MLYSMKFQTAVAVLTNISDTHLSVLDIKELKDRFNLSFVKNRECSAVTIRFVDNNIDKSFIAGFRNNRICIIDMQTKQEYSPKEFSEELNILQETLNF